MTGNPLKAALAGGAVVPGLFVMELASAGIGRIADAAGAGFVVYDMEHTGWTLETIARLVATTPLPSVVRVPSGESWLCGQVLDAGADGVMVPSVGSAAQAKAVVAACRYPPVGRRGLALGYAHDGYRPGDAAETMRRANEATTVIVQIETADGLRNVDSIAAVPGVDLLWVGHNDLTARLGIPGQFTHPDYLAALAAVLAACERQGKVAGINAGSVETAIAMADRGFRYISFGDIPVFSRALSAAVRVIAEHPGPPAAHRA